MASIRLWAVLVTLVLGGLHVPLTAQASPSLPPVSSDTQITADIAQLRATTDHRQIPWKVYLGAQARAPWGLNPWAHDAFTKTVDVSSHDRRRFSRYEMAAGLLTFLRRRAVLLHVTVRHTFVRSGPHDLYLSVEITDKAGSRLTAFTAHPPFPSDPDCNLAYTGVLWGEPGEYKGTVVLYDTVTKRSNVWHQRFRIPEFEKDALPRLDINAPRIGFVSDYAQPIYKTVVSLPVTDTRTLQVDVVADFSELIGMPALDHSLSGTMLATVLVSRLAPANGCVRITAYSSVQGLTLAAPTEPGKMRWGNLWRKIGSSRNRSREHTIDVSDWTTFQAAPAFLRDRLMEILSGSKACPGLPPRALHVVFVIAPGLRVAERSQLQLLQQNVALEPAQLPDPASYRIYYLHTRAKELSPSRDYLVEMLKPVQRHHFQASSPQDLRQALATILADLQGPSPQTAKSASALNDVQRQPRQ